jgi:hypothetical protein
MGTLTHALILALSAGAGIFLGIRIARAGHRLSRSLAFQAALFVILSLACSQLADRVILLSALVAAGASTVAAWIATVVARSQAQQEAHRARISQESAGAGQDFGNPMRVTASDNPFDRDREGGLFAESAGAKTGVAPAATPSWLQRAGQLVRVWSRPISRVTPTGKRIELVSSSSGAPQSARPRRRNHLSSVK